MATEEERAMLAQRLGILALAVLEADISVKRWRKGGARLIAQVRGRMIRRCDVSLEEFEQPIEETVDVCYAAAGDEIGMAPCGELILDPDGEELPEVLHGDGCDAGEAIAQHLVLALDPYPRKPDVQFDHIMAGEKVEKSSPFAVLCNLTSKRKDGGKAR